MRNMRKRELVDMVNALSVDPVWGCYTRAALELRWGEFSRNTVAVVYGDIDRVHALNRKYGHAGLDRIMTRLLHEIRHESRSRHGDIVASRYLNGDELVFLLGSGDAEEFCKRFQRDAYLYGIKITMSYTYTIKHSAFETVNPLDEAVQASKNAGKRGVIIGG